MKLTKLSFTTTIVAGLALLSACGDDVTNVTEKGGIDKVENFKSLPKCESDDVGSLAYVSDSAKVFACTETGWVTINGANGKDGVDGKDGEDGNDGENGNDGTKGTKGRDGKDGASCTVEELSSGNGYKVVCNGDSIGVLLNGTNGKQGEPGKQGDKGDNGADGKSCKLKDNNDGTITVTCDTTTTTLYKAMCGTTPYDPATGTCGGGATIQPSDPEVPSVCGDSIYDPTYYTCMGIMVILKPGVSMCGTTPYNVMLGQYKCVNDTLYSITDPRACGEYDPTLYSCAMGNLIPISGNNDPLYDPDEYDCDGTELWCKDESPNYRVQTGLDNDTRTSGYWFPYTDSIEGGASTIEWPVARGTEFDPYAFDNIVRECKGLCGTIALDTGEMDGINPYAGVYFNIVGETSVTDGTIAVGDVTAWEGICITYISTLPAKLVMELDEYTRIAVKEDQPVKSLAKAALANDVCIEWSDFRQGGWGKADRISGTEAATKLAALKFEISATDGSTGDFNIIRLRKYSDVN